MAAMPMIGTSEYRRVLNSGGFWVNGLDVAGEQRERQMRENVKNPCS